MECVGVCCVVVVVVDIYITALPFHHILMMRDCVSAVNTTVATVSTTPLSTTTEWLTDYTDIQSKFSLRSVEEPEDDLCYIVAGKPESIEVCHFNSETQTFIVIHGWTVR